MLILPKMLAVTSGLLYKIAVYIRLNYIENSKGNCQWEMYYVPYLYFQNSHISVFPEVCNLEILKIVEVLYSKIICF